MLCWGGWSKEFLAASVLNSVRDNYLAKVVNRSPLGNYIVFQGATGRNQALVAAFEQFLKKPIHVSPYCHLTGELGAALLCLEARRIENRPSSFFWEIQKINMGKETCRRCPNNCLLTVVKKNGQKSGWGMKCGREYSERGPSEQVLSAPEKRFNEVFKPLISIDPPETGLRNIKIGIPMALYNVDYASLWYNFLARLGFEVVLTKPSLDALGDGKVLVNSDFCTPMIISHGYIKQLLDQEVDYLFYPAIINDKDPVDDGKQLLREKISDAYYCYYSQYLPTIVSKLTGLEVEKKLISPKISFNQKSLEEISLELHRAIRNKIPIEMERSNTKEAFQEAYQLYHKIKADRTKSLVYTCTSEGKLKVVLLGRPYIMFDSVINQGLLAKMEEQGAELFWQEELPLEDFQPAYINKYYKRMHWHYGKRVLRAAEYCAQSADIFVVYLTCFRCSPDSFLISYIKDLMSYYDKPFLILQLDEHSSDVGYTTRFEAGLQSFRNFLKGEKFVKPSIPTQP